MEKFYKKITKEYNDEIYAKTKHYQKKYGFEIGTGEHDTWNNEADAFKHAFGSADMALKSSSYISKTFSDSHENKNKTNPEGEKNMDFWNNSIGREIAQEINKQYSRMDIIRLIQSKQMDDIIAEEIMKRMRNGELITHPSDKRKYDSKKGIPTGYASNPDKIFKASEIGKMSAKEFTKNSDKIFEQLKQGLIKPKELEEKDYTGYKNPSSNSDRIFTREDLQNFSKNEYSNFEKDIMAQLSSIGIPTTESLKNNSTGTVYVESYTRSDGTQVKGHFRSVPNK